jgi:hypothetical protein
VLSSVIFLVRFCSHHFRFTHNKKHSNRWYLHLSKNVFRVVFGVSLSICGLTRVSARSLYPRSKEICCILTN